MDDDPSPPPQHTDNVSAPDPPAKPPPYAPYTWRRYIHVLLPLAGYAFALHSLTQRSWLLAIPGGFPIALALVAGATGLGFVASVPLYPARNRPAAFPELDIPWSRRSIWRTLAISALHDFHWEGALTRTCAINFALSWIYVEGLGIDDDAKYKSAKALWVARLKRIGLYAAAAAFGTRYMQIPYVSGVCAHLFGVQLRLVFITFADVMLAHLLHPPLGLLGRARTLLYLVGTASIGFVMLHNSPLLDPWHPHLASTGRHNLGVVPQTSTCPLAAQALLYQRACYAQIGLADPLALPKQVACQRWYLTGRDRAAVDAELARHAPAVAAHCDGADAARARVWACIAQSTFGERFEPLGSAFDTSPTGVGKDGQWRRFPDRNVMFRCLYAYDEDMEALRRETGSFENAFARAMANMLVSEALAGNLSV